MFAALFGSPAPAPAPAPKVYKKYTRAQVQSEASTTAVLTIISGSVYDLTGFLEEHPGGSSVVMAYVGKDATGAFDAIGHSNSAHTWMKDFKVGELSDK